TLRPKVMIPTHYRTSAADEETCDIDPLDNFLELVEDMNIRQVNNNQLRLRFEDLPKEGTLIRVLNYQPALKA
ncbi:MAG: Zn-dependent hydrolase, partial [Crocosphaera sp.]|nr:Zn-dependent hydrolase [Crocosphaera sp.]